MYLHVNVVGGDDEENNRILTEIREAFEKKAYKIGKRNLVATQVWVDKREKNY